MKSLPSGRLLGLLTAVLAVPWLMTGCPAKFDPLPDDDSGASDDDSSAGDDDVADDDDDATGTPIIEPFMFALEEGSIYTFFLLGTAGNTGIAAVEDLSDFVTPGEHHLRIVHGGSTAGMVDVYVDAATNADLTGLTPRSVYPDPETVGYTSLGLATSYEIEVYPTNATYGDGSVFAQHTAAVSPDQFYTVVFTGRNGFRFITQTTDDMSEVTYAGKARIRVFHSLEDSQKIDVFGQVDSGATLSLGGGLQLGSMGLSTMVDAGMLTLTAYETAPE
jgi:hypothetical protein